MRPPPLSVVTDATTQVYVQRTTGLFRTHLKHIPELDGVRGLACFGVLFAHCLGGIMVTPPTLLAIAWSKTQYFLLGGVDLFFVLSGFLIGGILIDNRHSKNFFLAFWTRRAGRILPVLFMLVVSYCLIIALRPYLDTPSLDLWLLKEPVHSPLWYLTFTQTIPTVLSGAGPRWMGITWSLAIEEQFYLFFPLLVYFLPPRVLTFVVVGMVPFAWICRSLVHHFVGWYEAYVMLPCRLDCLAVGVLIAILVRSPAALDKARDYRLHLDVAIVLLVLAISEYKFHGWSSQLGEYPLVSTAVLSFIYTAIALLFALCILRIFLYRHGWYHRFLTWRPLVWLGLISYGLYMYHQAINGLMHVWLFDAEPSVASWRQAAVAVGVMVIAIAVATLSYRCVETPIRRWAQQVRFKATVPTLPSHRAEPTSA